MSTGKKNDPKSLHLTAAAIESAAESFSHPWNPQSEILGCMLAGKTGLQRVGVSWARLAPHKESFVYHRHYGDEEWIYILTGRAVALLDGERIALGAGDFLAFPNGTAHHLMNPHDEPMTYLMGGEKRSMEIVDYPEQGKRMVREGNRVAVYPIEAESGPFPGWEKL